MSSRIALAAIAASLIASCAHEPTAHALPTGPFAVYSALTTPAIPLPGSRRALIAHDVIGLPDRDTMAGHCFATGSRPSPAVAAAAGGAFRLDRDLVVYAIPGSIDPVLVAFGDDPSGANAAYVCANDITITLGPS